MLKAWPKKNKPKSAALCEAFAAGAPVDAEGHVFYGVDEHNIDVWYRVKASGETWYAIDNTLFDGHRGNIGEPHARFRVGRNCLQAEVRSQPPSTGRRFAALGIEIKPWQKNPNGHWVIAEQSPSFMLDVARDPDWYARTLTWAKSTGRRVVERRWSPNKLQLQDTLPQALRGAWGLLTYSSAAAVTALCEGVPPFVGAGSALTGISFDERNPWQRLAILSVLADNDFSYAELVSGEAYQWLNENRDGSPPKEDPVTGP